MSKKIIHFITLTLALFFAAGCGGVPPGGETAESGAVALIPVETVAVAERSLERQLKLSGEVQSEGKVDLLAGVTGTVSSINVNAGDKVEQGQLLLELNNDDLLLQVRQAEAALAQARATYISTRDISFPRRLLEMESGLYQSEINYRSASEQYERMDKLYQEEIISQTEYEQARDNYELALSGYNGAREQLRLEKDGQEKELAVLQAQLAQAEIQVEQGRTTLEKTRIKAPFAGTVTLVNASQGVEVSPGASLVSVVDFEQLYVAFDVTETNLSHLQMHAPVEVMVPAAGFIGKGTIEEIALSPTPGSKSYPAKAFFKADLPVRMGMHAELLVTQERVEDALVIPRRAVLQDGERHYVYVIENGIAVEQTMKPGLENEDYVEAMEGLSPGDEVVLRGQHYLVDGSSVEVVPAAGGDKG